MAEPLLVAIPASAIEALALRLAEHLKENVTSAPAAQGASPYLNVAEAADYLRCSEQRIYDLTSARQLPVSKEGTRSLYRREHLDALVKGPK